MAKYSSIGVTEHQTVNVQNSSKIVYREFNFTMTWSSTTHVINRIMEVAPYLKILFPSSL